MQRAETRSPRARHSTAVMQLDPLIAADADAARALFCRAPFTTLLPPRPSSEPPAVGNEHVGHVANDPALFRLLGLPLLCEGLPRDGLLALRWCAAPGSPAVLVGVASVRCAGAVGTIDCLAASVGRPATDGALLAADDALDAMLAGCVEHARGARSANAIWPRNWLQVGLESARRTAGARACRW